MRWDEEDKDWFDTMSGFSQTKASSRDSRPRSPRLTIYRTALHIGPYRNHNGFTQAEHRPLHGGMTQRNLVPHAQGEKSGEAKDTLSAKNDIPPRINPQLHPLRPYQCIHYPFHAK